MFLRNPPVHDPFGFGDADRLPGHVGFVEHKQYYNNKIFKELDKK